VRVVAWVWKRDGEERMVRTVAFGTWTIDVEKVGTGAWNWVSRRRYDCLGRISHCRDTPKSSQFQQSKSIV
jgi:hypothetical protein